MKSNSLKTIALAGTLDLAAACVVNYRLCVGLPIALVARRFSR